VMRRLSELPPGERALIEAEIRALVARSLRPHERVSAAAEIAAMTPEGATQSDSTQLIRADRDR